MLPFCVIEEIRERAVFCMKAFVALLLAALLAVGCAAAEGVSELGMRLLAEGWDGVGNALISPVSLGFALEMAEAGAAGQTREQLNVGGASQWSEALSAAGLRWANAAFVREDLQVRPNYIEALRDRFGAELFGLDDADAVNAWVDEHTDHLIDRMVDEIDPNLRLMLLNAIAMDAKWAVRFDQFSTGEDVFHAPGGDVTATFMANTFEVPYAQTPLGRAVRLDYRDSGLYMLVLLPEEGRMAEALAALAEDPLGSFQDMAQTNVWLRLPKLDLAVENRLNEGLMARGIVVPFTEAADFSGISDEELMISEVVQRARLQVDEEGTRAAAATEVGIMAKGGPEGDPPVVMAVDRPFIVLIAEETTGAVCFAGVVCDPTQN